MVLKIEVRGDDDAVLLEQRIEVPEDIPYPDDKRGPITLAGLKLAVDYAIWTARVPPRVPS